MSDHGEQSRHRETSARGLLGTLVALLVLAGASLALRFAHLGDFGFAVALGIAFVKALLVVIFFMEVLTEKVTSRLAFVAGITLVAVFVALVVADVLTRSPSPLDPPGTEPRYRG
jgi:cytochrome c oxidase subunit 4